MPIIAAAKHINHSDNRFSNPNPIEKFWKSILYTMLIRRNFSMFSLDFKTQWQNDHSTIQPSQNFCLVAVKTIIFVCFKPFSFVWNYHLFPLKESMLRHNARIFLFEILSPLNTLVTIVVGFSGEQKTIDTNLMLTRIFEKITRKECICCFSILLFVTYYPQFLIDW